MVLITGGTLDTAPPYKSTPGDDIFKGQRVIAGVCFHPCYTVASVGSRCARKVECHKSSGRRWCTHTRHVESNL